MWELNRDSPVQVPYHLETFIEGVPLSDRWTSQFSDEGTRMQILRSLAELMLQLHALQFDKIESLVFENDDASPCVDAMVQMKGDIDKMFNREEVWPMASLANPFESTKAYLLAKINVQKAVTERAAQWNNAELSLLCLAIDSIPQPLDTPQTFSLGHPDFNYQNIFTNDAGDITGLIDWDGV